MSVHWYSDGDGCRFPHERMDRRSLLWPAFGLCIVCWRIKRRWVGNGRVCSIRCTLVAARWEDDQFLAESDAAFRAAQIASWILQ